jgi:hypothetical protein
MLQMQLCHRKTRLPLFDPVDKLDLSETTLSYSSKPSGLGRFYIKARLLSGMQVRQKTIPAEASRASTLPSCQSSQSSASVRGPVGMCSSLFLAGMHVRTGKRGGDPLPRAGLSLIRKAMLWSWPA